MIEQVKQLIGEELHLDPADIAAPIRFRSSQFS